MKNKSSLLLICFVALLVFSCSKEKKLERTLHKKDGEWTISSVTWQKVVQGSSGQSVTLGTTTNAGKFVFEKDGSGSYNFTIDGTSYYQTFKWSVNDENISITKVSQTFDFQGNFTQLAIAFSGVKTGKNSIEIEGSETQQYSSGSTLQEVISGTFTLKKN